jgi:anaerobic magnesium-protoporphyrin IX monomethyl ester cyclase
MRVLLIKPSNLSDHIQPSLGLGYLATQIRSDHEVRIVDCMKDRLPGEQIIPVLEEFKPDLIGSQCYSMDLPSLKGLLMAVKNFNKEVVTIVGGAHATAAPEQTADFLGSELLDFVFVGEGEIGFPRFLKEMETSQNTDFNLVPGLAWRINGKLMINPSEQTEDLDSLGMPAWDLIKPETYPFSPHGVVCKNFPTAPVMATRGCPHRCTFCSTAGKKLRKRSKGLLLEEIELLYHKHGIREFHMVDDNFTMDMNYAKSFLHDLINKNIKASWATPNGVRLDRLDRELIELMKEAGFYSISVGIESGSERMRKKIRKGTDIEKVRKDLKKVYDIGGIDITGFFMLGFPGETSEDIEKTLKFSRELPLHRATFHSFIPLPGTELWREMEANGELENVDWNRYFFWAGAYVPRGLTHKDLKKYHRKAFLLFYLRPRIILHNLKYLFDPRVALHAFRYLWRRIKG